MHRLKVDCYVGYHWEGGDTFIEDHNGTPLTMDSLCNDRVLYLCADPHQWAATHLDMSTFTLLEIKFKLPKEFIFTKWWDYQSYKPLYGVGTIPKQTQRLIDNGYRMFSIWENDRGELQESFIINPTKYVTSINPINYSIK